MNEPDISRVTDESRNSPEGFTGETDRTSGEYHYKSGYTQRIYSDAHYVPADETTAPPRYYTPHARNAKEAVPENRRSRGGTMICICLICALLGGIVGAAAMGAAYDKRLDALETAASAAQTQLPMENEPEAVMQMSAETDYAAIYAEACSQVVGITTEVTYTNFFGFTSSNAVTGSGFFISEDGYILTNYHVIEYAYDYHYTVTVMTHDGTRYNASIVGVEKDNDVAVLKIDADGMHPVTMADSDRIDVGDHVAAVGNPLGELEFTMTFGRVSALNRAITTSESNDTINMFQIDAAVNSGNSGGPVYDARGNVIGIVSAKYSSSGVEGLGFAIPINDARAIADDLIENGYVTGKATLNIVADQRYSAVYSRYYGLPEGAYVEKAAMNGCAYLAGIRPGDIITAIDGEKISSYSELISAVKRYGAGDSAEVSYYRSGEVSTVTVVFDEARP